MKKATGKSASTLPRKVYQPPVIIVLGEMLKGNGATCSSGGIEFGIVDCDAGGVDNDIYCGTGSAATHPY